MKPSEKESQRVKELNVPGVLKTILQNEARDYVRGKPLGAYKSCLEDYLRNLICKGPWHCLDAFVNQAVA